MFLAIIFIILGLLLLLNAMGIVLGNFWGFFWAIIFLAIGISMLMKRGRCPMCSTYMWGNRMHRRMHEGCGDEECDCECDEDDDDEDEEEDVRS